MYLNHYKLKEYPFSLTCEEKYFYESSVHREALGNMLYAVQQRKGMVLITGEVGAGKSFMGTMLCSRLGPGCQTVILQNPPDSKKQLLRSFARHLGISTAGAMDKGVLEENLQEYLVRMHSRGRLVGLILDEAQDLNQAVLKEIRLIWNWEQNGQRLVQIVLVGQPELRERLLEPKWEPLRQRIVLSYHLPSLTAEDTTAYIYHRLRIASDHQGVVEFRPEALALIHSATDGIPRLINIVCDNALLVGYVKGVHGIDPAIVTEVLRDMTCWGLQTSKEEIGAGRSPAGE